MERERNVKRERVRGEGGREREREGMRGEGNFSTQYKPHRVAKIA